MWRTAEEIEDDLRSGDPVRIAAGLETLEFHMDSFEPVEVALPTADLLDPFGDELPEEVSDRFAKLVDRYEEFEPAPSRAEREREAALAAARFGPSSLALKSSLMLKMADDPELAVRRALAAIAERGVQPSEAEHAGAFLSYLLAGRAPVRAATVEAMVQWRGRPDLDAAIEWIEPELEDDERAAVFG